MELIQSDSGLSKDRIVCGADADSCKGIKRLVLLVVLLTVLAGGIFSARDLKSDQSSKQDRGDAVNNLNLSLTTQQLDEIFQLLLVRLTSGEVLSPEDSFLLQSWLQFDERFVEQNQAQDSLKYERVSAHLRLGKGLLLLDKPISSIAHFQSAIELLDALIKENPVLVSYRLELSDSYQNLAACLEQAGHLQEAIGAYDTAIRTLRDPGLPEEARRQERLDRLYQQRDRVFSLERSAQ